MQIIVLPHCGGNLFELHLGEKVLISKGALKKNSKIWKDFKTFKKLIFRLCLPPLIFQI